MPWNDDSWRDSYDAWKAREPEDHRDDDDPDPEACDHDEFDIDPIEGRATCNKCCHRWDVTPEQVLTEVDRQRAYDEWCAEEEP